MKKLNIIIVAFLLLSIDMFSQSNSLPLIELNTQKINFGKTRVYENKCSTLVIKNIGDTISNLSFADKILAPFTGNIKYLQEIDKGDSVQVDICYNPVAGGNDSQRVFITLDTRLSHSIGLLFDVSQSMNDALSDGVRGITASVNAGKIFINSMLATAKVYDEAAIYSFCKSFYKNCDYTTDKSKLKNSLSTTLCNSTGFYDAVYKTTDDLKTRKFAKVLIALTDGEDNASTRTLSNCISYAKTNNIKIYTVGVGSSIASNELKSLAESTGGEFFNAKSSKELDDIYYKIFNLLSRNISIYFDIIGKSIDPIFTIDCPDDKYAAVGDSITYPIYLKNVDTLALMNQPFTLKMKFNQTLLLPVDVDFKFNSDGTTDIKGFNESNLDSLPLITLKFFTLIGNSDSTDIELISVKWDSLPKLPIITSEEKCSIFYRECIINLKQVQLFNNFYVTQNYPNPFSGSTNIDIGIEKSGYYQLSIYNQLGEKIIDNAINKKLEAGDHTIKFDSEELETGIYFYVLKTPKGNFTGSMNIIK